MPILWYRYRHLSSAIERQQIKWAAFGISIVTVGFVVRLVLPLLNPTLNQPGALYNSLSTPVLIETWPGNPRIHAGEEWPPARMGK